MRSNWYGPSRGGGYGGGNRGFRGGGPMQFGLTPIALKLIIVNVVMFVLTYLVFNNIPVPDARTNVGGTTIDQYIEQNLSEEGRQALRESGKTAREFLRDNDPEQYEYVEEQAREFRAQIANVSNVYLSQVNADVLQYGRWYTLFTSMFMHSDLRHLFFNMLGLFFFAGPVERFLGDRKFLLFYLLTGLIGNLVYLVLMPTSTAFSLGASGSVLACLIAFCTLNPNASILLMFILPVPAWFIGVATAFTTVLLSLQTIGGGSTGGINHLVHLMGVINGFLIIRFPGMLDKLESWLFAAELKMNRYMKGAPKKRGAPRQGDPDYYEYWKREWDVDDDEDDEEEEPVSNDPRQYWKERVRPRGVPPLDVKTPREDEPLVWDDEDEEDDEEDEPRRR